MPSEYYTKVKSTLSKILIANIVVAITKIILGYIAHSSSLIADGFHSFTDATSNVVAFIGTHFASKPVDEDHPYGHNKFETLAGLFISAMLFFISGRIIYQNIFKTSDIESINISFLSILILILTLLVNIFVCIFEHRQGKRLNSQILISDSLHTRGDIFISVGVILTLISVNLGAPIIIDSIVSIIIALFILYTGIEIFKDTSGVLVDKAAVDTEEIKNITMKFEHVKNVHNIRSRGSNREIYIDMHVMVNPELSIRKSHALSHQIEHELREKLEKHIHVIVHIEPYEDN